MSTLLLSCNHLLLDASTVISLYASQRIDAILQSLPIKVAVIDLTRQQEILYIWNGPDHNVRESTKAIDLQPLIDCKLLLEVSLDDTEYEIMVNLAAHRMGNGESAATAVALNRGWGVCTDDYKALPRLRQFAPDVSFITTSHILKQWATVTCVTEADIRKVIQSMHIHGGYRCGAQDTLVAWVRHYEEV